MSEMVCKVRERWNIDIVMKVRQNNFTLIFFFNDTATTEIYTLSLHDALPISMRFKPAL